jgi:Tfp pilus assembly protein PilF
MKHALILRACIIVIAIVGLANLAHAQRPNPTRVPTSDSTSTGSIDGRVVLPSGQPVSSRIKIILSTLNDPGVTLYTDTNGNFTFTNLRPGTYSVEASSDTNSYEPVIEQVRLYRGMRANLVIPLKEKPTAASQKPGAGAVVSVAELDPNIPSAAKKEYNRATNLANSGKAEEAIAAYKKALSIYPGYLVAHNDLGVQYLALKRAAEAVDEFGAAIEINPQVFNPRLNMGIALVQQERFLEAIEHLNQAVSIDSSAPAARLYLGIASAETDELEVAERELGLALSSGGSEYVIARYYLAQVHMKRGNRDQAVTELKTYLEKSPEGVYAARARQLLEKLKQ